MPETVEVTLDVRLDGEPRRERKFTLYVERRAGEHCGDPLERFRAMVVGWSGIRADDGGAVPFSPQAMERVLLDPVFETAARRLGAILGGGDDD